MGLVSASFHSAAAEKALCCLFVFFILASRLHTLPQLPSDLCSPTVTWAEADQMKES